MFQIDFLQTSASAKSADAITAQFTIPGRGTPAVVVIDAGYTGGGEIVAAHLDQWYGTDHADLVAATHGDANHVNGVPSLLELITTDELLIHQPSLHGHGGSEADCDAIHEAVSAARSMSARVTEPFTGLRRFGGLLTVVGPTASYYEALLGEQVGRAMVRKALAHLLAESLSLGREVARSVLPWQPKETLADDAGGTSARNNSSMIVDLRADGYRALLTGDAGVPALARALDFMDGAAMSMNPLNVFQIPHHGSRHNLDAALLDRLLGPAGVVGLGPREAIVSAARDDPKHPHPKISNAVKRRSFVVCSTEQGSICCNLSGPDRPGWSPAKEEPWYDEAADDEEAVA